MTPQLDVTADTYGVTSDGESVERYTLSNGAVTLQCITYGGVITRLLMPDRMGRVGDIALGFDGLAQYERDSPYFGAIVGRYANRLAHARFSLDGTIYQLDANEGSHHLHGGYRGFDKRLWQADVIRGPSEVGVAFSRTSPAGEERYPGALHTRVSYRLTERNQVLVDFDALASADTIVNLTQHTYFNLAGPPHDIRDHVLTVHGSHYLPADRDLIPTGEVAPVAGTPFDFLAPHAIGDRLDDQDIQLHHGGGYDHTWVLDARTNPSAPVATLYEPRSGRRLEVATTEPGLQVYSGNRLAVTAGRGGQPYPSRTGLCLETQHFPDSPAHPHFPSTVVRAGERTRSTTIWTFSWE